MNDAMHEIRGLSRKVAEEIPAIPKEISIASYTYFLYYLWRLEDIC